MKIQLSVLAYILLTTIYLSSIGNASNSFTIKQIQVPVPSIVEPREINISDQEKLVEVAKNKELQCMAKNIYHEARGENLAGMFAVADVVLNRVESPSFPNTICGVVYQSSRDSHGRPKRNKCHFSWYCDGKEDKIDDERSWKISQIVAYNITEQGQYLGITEGADHYHLYSMKRKPYWIEDFYEIGNIGDHTFYASR